MDRFCSARPGPDSVVTSFRFQDDEITAVDETLPTVVVDQTLYACGDTGGYPIAPVNGNPVSQLGVNVPEVAERLYKAFLPERTVGAGYFRLNDKRRFNSNQNMAFGVLFFLIQKIRQEFGRATEEELEIQAHVIVELEGKRELNSQECADLIRDLYDATKMRDPVPSGLRSENADCRT